MTEAISWLLTVRIRDGEGDAFASLMHEMIDATRDEPGALIYEWFMADDDATVHIYERYRDSDAVLAHLAMFAGIGGRFFDAVDVAGFEVYGDPSPEARAGLGAAGASFSRSLGGFAT